MYSAGRGPGALVRAPTKTIAFTGASGLGLAGVAVPVWTVTGRALLFYMAAFVSETLVSTINLGTIALGTAARTTGLLPATTVGAGELAAGDWWQDGNDPEIAMGVLTVALGQGATVSANIIISPATQDITDGTLVLDCWYIPLTAGAGLA